MLISSSKDQPKISERDLILANALAYVESIEEKIAKQDHEKEHRATDKDRSKPNDRQSPEESANA